MGRNTGFTIEMQQRGFGPKPFFFIKQINIDDWSRGEFNLSCHELFKNPRISSVAFIEA